MSSSLFVAIVYCSTELTIIFIRLRKPLDDILLSLSSNWPPVECLKDGIPIEAGKGLSMTERYLRNKGLLGDAVFRLPSRSFLFAIG